MKVRMFGYSNIFRSRWKALLWAAGIIWLAVEVATPDAPPSTNRSFQQAQ
jgi:hypothetical protein